MSHESELKLSARARRQLTQPSPAQPMRLWLALWPAYQGALRLAHPQLRLKQRLRMTIEVGRKRSRDNVSYFIWTSLLKCWIKAVCAARFLSTVSLDGMNCRGLFNIFMNVPRCSPTRIWHFRFHAVLVMFAMTRGLSIHTNKLLLGYMLPSWTGVLLVALQPICSLAI